MAHHQYVYRPWSEQRRQKARDLHRHRLGIPEGHVRIYGVHVPEAHEQPFRYWASWVASKHGFAAGNAFMVRAKAVNFLGIEKPSPDVGGNRKYGQTDWTLVRELIHEGASVEEIAEFLGVSARHMAGKLKGYRSAL